MNNLALSDEILLKIEKPVRYIGNEVNMVRKDPEGKIRFAMCFPDVYEIGMSHLGMKIIYDQMNRRDDVYCERVFSPWVDLDKVMREENIPLFALESQDPVFMFDFLAVTIQYEMCYTNILQILDLSQIGIYAKDRREDAPFVIGGGPCTYNPEPLADFFDMFYIGESETVYYDLMDLYKEHKKNGGNRKEFLRKASHIPGIYVPSLYETTYNEDGTIASFEPLYEDVPRTILKQVQMDLTNTFYPEKQIVPYIKVTQDRCVLEIQRGCTRGCRFCQAGMIYRPLRERSLPMLEELAAKGIKGTGNDEISLSSLSSSDYSHLPELCNYLIDNYRSKNINIALPSLRIDAFSLDVMSKVQDVRKSSLTFAPEAGTQRMRDVINKGLTEEVILHGAMEAFKGGWSKVKLYFMMGLPTETDEDIKGIIELAQRVVDLFYSIPNRPKGKGVQVSISTATFVPKPFTPFEFEPQATREEIMHKQQVLMDSISSKKIKASWHDPSTSILEAVLARGDRRLGQVIYKAWQKGSKFDSWGEHFNFNNWSEAFDECGLTMEFYASRKREYDEVMPWDHLDYYISKEFLVRENKKARAAQTTEHCRNKCSACGVSREIGRACFE